MAPQDLTLTLFERITQEAGITSSVLFLVALGASFLYYLERKDRREAWKAYNSLLKESISVQQQLTGVIRALETRIQGLTTYSGK